MPLQPITSIQYQTQKIPEQIEVWLTNLQGMLNENNVGANIFTDEGKGKLVIANEDGSMTRLQEHEELNAAALYQKAQQGRLFVNSEQDGVAYQIAVDGRENTSLNRFERDMVTEAPSLGLRFRNWVNQNIASWLFPGAHEEYMAKMEQYEFANKNVLEAVVNRASAVAQPVQEEAPLIPKEPEEQEELDGAQKAQEQLDRTRSRAELYQKLSDAIDKTMGNQVRPVGLNAFAAQSNAVVPELGKVNIPEGLQGKITNEDIALLNLLGTQNPDLKYYNVKRERGAEGKTVERALDAGEKARRGTPEENLQGILVNGLQQDEKGFMAYRFGMLKDARTNVQSALNAAAEGNYDQLGKLLADGINAANANIRKIGGKMNNEHLANGAVARRALALMDKMPELKDAVMANGLSEDNLAFAKGNARLCELHDKNYQNILAIKDKVRAQTFGTDDYAMVAENVLYNGMMYMAAHGSSFEHNVAMAGRDPDGLQSEKAQLLQAMTPKLNGMTGHQVLEFVNNRSQMVRSFQETFGQKGLEGAERQNQLDMQNEMNKEDPNQNLVKSNDQGRVLGGGA